MWPYTTLPFSGTGEEVIQSTKTNTVYKILRSNSLYFNYFPINSNWAVTWASMPINVFFYGVGGGELTNTTI
jgi:hypothetical protein